MAQPELASQIHRLFPAATPLGRASWSVTLQNGRSHLTRVFLEDDNVVLTTGPIAMHGSPQSVVAMNASLPAASRIVSLLMACSFGRSVRWGRMRRSTNSGRPRSMIFRSASILSVERRFHSLSLSPHALLRRKVLNSIGMRAQSGMAPGACRSLTSRLRSKLPHRL